MGSLLLKSDLKTLFMGAAPMVLAGLILGAAMHPDLAEGADAQGPQLLTGVSATRTDAAYAQQASILNYRGHVPDYVIGTDWLQPVSDLRADAGAEPQPDDVIDAPDPSDAAQAENEAPVVVG
jgi:hypothetical protein